MNRNVESYFSLAPQVAKPRSTFDRSHDIQTTFNVGDLIVLDCSEVYPGDTFKVRTAKNIRLQTLLNPLFGTLYLDTYHFFVPDRIEYDHSEELFGENKTSPWVTSTQYVTPKITVNATDKEFLLGSIADYFGLPVGVDKLSVNAIPFRAYHDIWDTYFRDQNTQQPLNIYKGAATKALNAGSASDDYSELYPWPRKACRYHDYFSSCTPAPQKGPSVTIPLGTVAPVYSTDTFTPYYSDPLMTDLTVSGMVGYVAAGVSGTSTKEAGIRAKSALPSNGGLADASVFGHSPGTTSVYDFTPLNLWADLGTSAAASINDLRQAFQIQKMYELDTFGTRYYEILRNHFGITSPDSRLQRPEYLGGNRIALNVHQVVNSAESSSYDLGNLGAMSHTVDLHDDYVKSFVEHGFCICVAVVRYENVFSQGIERFWSRDDRFSYYWPSLAHLGNMSVKNREIYAQGTTKDDEVFGYQEAWADLRYANSKCTSLMRPGVSGSLAAWNLCDYYTSLPTLSAGWIESDKGIVDRTLAVTSSVSNQILLECHFDMKCTRVLPMYSMPGLIDHF